VIHPGLRAQGDPSSQSASPFPPALDQGLIAGVVLAEAGSRADVVKLDHRHTALPPPLRFLHARGICSRDAMTRRIYLDHAATTPLRPEAAAVLRELEGEPLNASSVHRGGQRARRLLEGARAELAEAIGARETEVVFTSGATESNNLAIRGMVDAQRDRPLRVASSALEHACIRGTLTALLRLHRVEVTALGVQASGRASIDVARGADLLCLLAVQNETGVVQDLGGARACGVPWLCDASQAFGKIALRVNELGAHLVTISSHKIGGPLGIGALAGPGVAKLTAQITGGPQEAELRAGTQAVPLAVAFARAASLAVAEREAESARRLALEGVLLGALTSNGIEFTRNGDEPRAAGFVNISIRGFEGSDLVIALDARGFDTSSGAACSTGVMEISPAISAMFPGDAERAAGALRITFGRATNEADVLALAAAVRTIVEGRR